MSYKLAQADRDHLVQRRQREAPSRGNPSHPQVSGARKVLAVLVEGDGHDAVSGVERLLHAVAVMDVDVDVQHALVVPARNGRNGHTVASRAVGKLRYLQSFKDA